MFGNNSVFIFELVSKKYDNAGHEKFDESGLSLLVTSFAFLVLKEKSSLIATAYKQLNNKKKFVYFIFEFKLNYTAKFD